MSTRPSCRSSGQPRGAAERCFPVAEEVLCDAPDIQMIVGYHLIMGAYGFWLPNDPRGSGSRFVGSKALYAFGPATKTSDSRSLAHRNHDRTLRLAAKSALQHPPVRFTGLQARAVGRGFGSYVARSGLPVWACAILPDHAHLVLGRSGLPIEQVAIQLKKAATEQLVRESLHPLPPRPDGRPRHCWVRGHWAVYLDPPDVVRAIRYVENNPLKEGKPRQTWSFVSACPL